MINGQVAVMRLLSALFFICRKTTVIESARLSGAQPVRRTVLGGLGDAHQQAESFLYKRTLLASTENYLHLSLQWMFVNTDFI